MDPELSTARLLTGTADHGGRRRRSTPLGSTSRLVPGKAPGAVFLPNSVTVLRRFCTVVLARVTEEQTGVWIDAGRMAFNHLRTENVVEEARFLTFLVAERRKHGK